MRVLPFSRYAIRAASSWVSFFPAKLSGCTPCMRSCTGSSACVDSAMDRSDVFPSRRAAMNSTSARLTSSSLKSTAPSVPPLSKACSGMAAEDIVTLSRVVCPLSNWAICFKPLELHLFCASRTVRTVTLGMSPVWTKATIASSFIWFSAMSTSCRVALRARASASVLAPVVVSTPRVKLKERIVPSCALRIATAASSAPCSTKSTRPPSSASFLALSTLALVTIMSAPVNARSMGLRRPTSRESEERPRAQCRKAATSSVVHWSSARSCVRAARAEPRSSVIANDGTRRDSRSSYPKA
mmetsp:Transcript_18925/g.60013  ORF Transcript_18925/g.60013 Transcript_18925/m.60013 type:complete len:299 (-) Transcript_18925:224-1120(-)